MANDAAVETQNVAGAITSMRIDELISNLAIGIAEGQLRLDQVCMDIAKFMGDAQVAFGKRAGSEEPDLLSLIELGFTPNFYQFVDTILEVRVAVSSKFEEKRETDTSVTQFQQNEFEQQSKYEQQQQSASSGSGYSAGGGWSWGWGGGGWSYGQSSYGYSGSSSAQQSGATAVKSKNIALTAVDAKYASTYNFAVEGSSTIKTKIVPVPPPAVFEETVRAKVKERRDWEQRMRWTVEARGILSGLVSSATALIANDGPLTKSADWFGKDHASIVHDAIGELKKNYDGLTTNHWTVITNVSDREVTDARLAGAVNQAQKLFNLFQAPEAPMPSAVEPILTGLNKDLGTFNTKAAEMLKRISPPEKTATA